MIWSCLPYSGVVPVSMGLLALVCMQGIKDLIHYTAEKLLLFYNHPASMHRFWSLAIFGIQIFLMWNIPPMGRMQEMDYSSHWFGLIFPLKKKVKGHELWIGCHYYKMVHSSSVCSKIMPISCIILLVSSSLCFLPNHKFSVFPVLKIQNVKVK